MVGAAEEAVRYCHMHNLSSVYDAAKKDEGLFKNVLRDLRENRRNDKRFGFLIPPDLDSTSDLVHLVEKYSKIGNSRGFSITHYDVSAGKNESIETAVIQFQDSSNGGGGARLEYHLNGKGLEYKGPKFIF